MQAFLSVRGRRWRRIGLLAMLLLLSMSRPAGAQVFGTVRVVARDQQNLAIANADATISSKSSTWVQTAKTNREGEAIFAAVPFGAYMISVTAAGFEASTK